MLTQLKISRPRFAAGAGPTQLQLTGHEQPVAAQFRSNVLILWTKIIFTLFLRQCSYDLPYPLLSDRSFMMETMLLFLCSFVALLVLVYLVYALLNAEKF